MISGMHALHYTWSHREHKGDRKVFEFGDAINPVNIPFEYAALYSADCDYPCPPAQDRWDAAHKRWITFRGAKECSIIDYEPGTRDYQTPELVTGWLKDRDEDHEIKRPSWGYCDLSNAASFANAAGGYHFLWWIATLDGIRRSRQELSALLLDWGVPIRLTNPALIAANQWQNAGVYDASSCFDGWDG
jgi:hypothetical protein